MEFRELSDEEWSLISSYLPPRPSRGRRPVVDVRTIINVILYVLSS